MVDLRGVFASFARVHPAQWTHGRFDMWLTYYDWAGRYPQPSALQVLWPAEDVTVPGELLQPRLDRNPGGNVNGLNRAQRRRKERRR